MKRTLPLAFAFMAFSVGVVDAAPRRSSEQPPLQHEMMGVENGCFVETVAFLDHWRDVHGDSGAWAQMLQWGAKQEEETVAGHAVGVCQSGHRLWSWDINYGWTPLTLDSVQREDVNAVAAAVTAPYTRIKPQYPTYRADFPQPPCANALTADPANANPSVRDATIVGARLAAHRPVNVMRFDYPQGDQLKESAAVIFMFNGRYCVYVPEYGTVPFRAHGGVENLRIITEALRRMISGATNFRKLM